MMMRILLLAASLQALLTPITAFTTPSSHSPTTRNSPPKIITRYNTQQDDENDTKKLTLEEKMASWEASEEEIRAATLGGVVPASNNAEGRSDAFDIGLYIAFPIMVIGCLIFAFFPLIVSNIDVSSVGPPPTS